MGVGSPLRPKYEFSEVAMLVGYLSVSVSHGIVQLTPLVVLFFMFPEGVNQDSRVSKGCPIEGLGEELASWNAYVKTSGFLESYNMWFVLSFMMVGFGASTRNHCVFTKL